MIKQNESQLANTVFEIQQNKADSFFCFLLFVQSFNCLYLWNQLPNLCGIFTKLKPKQYPNRKCQKNKHYFFRLETYLLDRITYINKRFHQVLTIYTFGDLRQTFSALVLELAGNISQLIGSWWLFRWNGKRHIPMVVSVTSFLCWGHSLYAWCVWTPLLHVEAACLLWF